MRRVLLLSLFVTGTLTGQTTRVLTLEQATAIAVERSRVLGIGGSRADADRAKATETASSRYAGLSLFGGYTRIEDGTFRLSTTNLQSPLPVGPVPVNNYVLRLGLRQPLFTGFRISSAVDAANLLADASQLDVAMIREDLALNVASAYWLLYQARQLEHYAGENVRRIESYLRDTERLVTAGVMTRSDLLRVQVQLSNARIAELEASNDAGLAVMSLNNVMGEPTDAPIELASRPEEVHARDTTGVLPAEGPADELVGLALQRRPDIQAAATRVRAAGASTGVARGAWWPQIDLIANYNYNNPNSRYQPITKEFLGSWDVGVSLMFDLWNWGATSSRVEQAEAMYRLSDLQERQMKDNVALEVNRSALNLRKSREKLSVAELAVSLAAENLRILSDKYRTGLATSTELLDAEVALVLAQTQHSGTQVEVAVARALLRRALGGSETGTPR
jgi:outer membrane protein TolC